MAPAGGAIRTSGPIAVAQHGVGDQGDSVELDQHGRVTEPADHHRAIIEARHLDSSPDRDDDVRTYNGLGPRHGRSGGSEYGKTASWAPEVPRFRPLRLLLSWIVAAAAVLVASAIVPGVTVGDFGDAFVAAVLIAALNAILPPIVAALRLPLTLVLGFLIILVLDALILLLASEIDSSAIHVDSFGWALLAALVISAVVVVLDVVLGANDDDTYSLRVITRIARRQGTREATDAPGLVFLEIDGLALPVLQRAMRDGNVPTLARWMAGRDSRPRRVGDGPQLSDRSQPGGDPARLQRGHTGVPLGREGDREARDLLVAGRLRVDREPARLGQRAARARRRQPRQPVLRRGR